MSTGAGEEGGPEDVADDADDAEAEADEALSEPTPKDVVLDSGDAALTLHEAGELASERGATVVVIAGAQAVGKTTMAVTLWGQFLHGPFANLRFAGSHSLDAFDQRQFAARLSSGNLHPDTLRTEDEDLRLLHLRVAEPDGTLTDLMPSDIKGEFFEDVINGRAATSGLRDLVARADKVVVAVDGLRIATLVERAAAIFDAEQLIGGLTEPGWMHPSSPLLVLLTKLDLVEGTEAETWYDTQAEHLCAFASTRGLNSVSSAKVSARPVAKGFDHLLEWMVRPIHRDSGADGRVEPVEPVGSVFATGMMT